MGGPSGASYQWHPDVHRRWGGEQLYFWHLAFNPTYDRDKIVAGLETVFERHGVTAYTVYELFAGGYDIFLRVWLPTSQRAFENDLHDVLSEYTIAPKAFWVDRIILHWPWEGEPGALTMRQVSDDVLRQRLPDAEIARINAGGLSRSQRAPHEARNLIAKVPRRKGIKFFTLVTTPHQSLTRYATQRLEDRILEVLRASSGIFEKSVYSGAGFGLYLIMGRVTDYFAIERELTTPLNLAADPSLFGARTTTFPVSCPEFLTSRYELRIDDTGPAARSAEDALGESESQTLEVKGSAFANLDRWLHAGGKLVADDRVVDHGLLKAVTGMLNADGGTVLIGALERARFEEETKLKELPRRGEYVVVGIESDQHGEDWDRYERRLRALLKSRIKPDPTTRVGLAREEIDGRTVVVITVYPSEDWFYHYPAGNEAARFWVRQGNATHALEGPDSDAYRREKGRVS